MEIVICPECKIRVVPSASGDCPSCNRHHETFLPYSPSNCTEQKAPSVERVTLASAEPERELEAKNLWNVGAILAPLAVGVLILYLQIMNIPIPLGTLGLSLSVSMATAAGGIVGNWIGLPKFKL